MGDVVAGLGPCPRRDEELVGEDGGSGRHLHPPEAGERVSGLVVEPGRRGRRLRHPVDHDVGQQLVPRKDRFRVAVAVAPGPELLDDPRRLPRGRVVESVAQGLGLRSLDLRVSVLLAGVVGLARQRTLELLRRNARRRVIHAGRRLGHHHVDVQPGDLLRVLEGVPPADDAAPVAALRAVALVSEPRHQLRVDVGDLLGAEARFARLVGETVAGHRRRHDVKRVGRVAAVRGRVGQRADHLQELGHRPGPPVGDDERQRILFGGALVDEVDVEPIDHGLILIQRVEAPLRRPPVELVAPVGDQVGHVAELRPVVPPDVLQLIGQAGARQPLAQIVEHGVRHVDRERPDCRRIGLTLRGCLARRREHRTRHHHRDRTHATCQYLSCHRSTPS